ncbi:hypothetical protein H0266_17830 [Halobacillus locisalis]|uniref:Uncharacterized protein n=1 Tax=Halobacillus locisalis TaxID=220753 RepID=A0A838CXU8_9BACI|nr:hypothetical protein [Halobacillus locisalis]MBA2176753.1 hypothetical protein [Halobacillus locisalis]
MKKFLVGISFTVILLIGSIFFSPLSLDELGSSRVHAVEVASSEDPGDSGVGAPKPMDNTDPGDSGVG